MPSLDGETNMMGKRPDQFRLNPIDLTVSTLSFHIRDSQSGITTGIDLAEWRKIHSYIERKPMVSVSLAVDLESQCRNLGALVGRDIDSGSAWMALSLYLMLCQHLEDGCFQSSDKCLHPKTVEPPAQVNQQVNNRLSGTMVSGISTPVSPDNRNLPCIEDIGRISRFAKGKDRRMLNKPDFIKGLWRAHLGELLHPVKCNLIREDSKLADTLSNLEIGEMIPPELYEVVAEILVFVDRMEKLRTKMDMPKK